MDVREPPEPWSAEDRACYAKWVRSVTIFYGSIGFAALATMAAGWWTGAF